MAQYYADSNVIVMFEGEDDDWMRDANAPARIRSPHSEAWSDASPCGGLADSVKQWESDHHEIAETDVPRLQHQLRRPRWARDGSGPGWPPVWVDGRLVKLVCDQRES
jgi:hypothetical protein